MDDHNSPSQNGLRSMRAMRIYFAIAVWLGVIAMYAALILPDYGAAHSGPRMRSKNKLKAIGLAFHNYHDVFGMFPDEVSGESWATQLLPYLDRAPLYDSMDHSKSWSDPINKEVSRQTILYLLNPFMTRNTTHRDTA